VVQLTTFKVWSPLKMLIQKSGGSTETEAEDLVWAGCRVTRATGHTVQLYF
jgi:hypothetical protein